MNNQNRNFDQSQVSFRKEVQNNQNFTSNKSNQQQFIPNKKIILYDVPQIEQYKKVNRPYLEQNKKIQIVHKLKIQQEAHIALRNRQAKNDYFIKYGVNPFINLEGKRKEQFGKIVNGVQIKEEKKIVDEKQNPLKLLMRKFKAKKDQYPDLPTTIINLKQKKFQDQIIQNRDKFKKLKKSFDLFSGKNIQDAINHPGIAFFKNKNKIAQQLSQCILTIGSKLAQKKKKQAIQTKNNQKNEKFYGKSRNKPNLKAQNDELKKHPLINNLFNNDLSFQRILQIKQQNFLYGSAKSRKNQISIFDIAFQKDNRQPIGKQLLLRNYFNFNSYIEKFKLFKTSIYRDLSKLARQYVLSVKSKKQNILDYIQSSDIGYKLSQLKYQDVMNLATGRFNPQFIYKMMNYQIQNGVNNNNNNQKEKSQTSSKQLQTQIFYASQTSNKCINFYNNNQQHQILTYLRIPATDQQILAQQKYQKYSKDIQENFAVKQKLLNQTIRDKDIHQHLNRKTKRKIDKFLALDQTKDLDIDKYVRLNKGKKYKNNSIKMKHALEMFDAKKNHDQFLQNIGIAQQNQQDVFLRKIAQIEKRQEQRNEIFKKMKSKKRNNKTISLEQNEFIDYYQYINDEQKQKQQKLPKVLVIKQKNNFNLQLDLSPLNNRNKKNKEQNSTSRSYKNQSNLPQTARTQNTFLLPTRNKNSNIISTARNKYQNSISTMTNRNNQNLPSTDRNNNKNHLKNNKTKQPLTPNYNKNNISQLNSKTPQNRLNKSPINRCITMKNQTTILKQKQEPKKQLNSTSRSPLNLSKALNSSISKDKQFFHKKPNNSINQSIISEKKSRIVPLSLFSYNGGKNNYMNNLSRIRN